MTIPAAMRAERRWVCWRMETRNGKPTKVPMIADPRWDRHAQSNNPRTWRDYDLAVKAASKFDGTGFALGDGWVGIDLDNCRDPETGEIDAWATAIVDLLDSYSEVSPSGRGLHVICRGEWAAGWSNKRGTISSKAAGIEVYAAGRYFTVTAETIRDGEAPDRTMQLAHLAAMPLPFDPPRLVPVTETRDDSDSEVLARIRHAANAGRILALWDGDTSGHGGDASRADAALANHLVFWCRGDVDQADRLFRQSALWRPKWDERHAADGRTYGRMTLDRAARAYQVDHGASGRRNGATAPATEWSGDILHDFSALLDADLPEPRHPVPGLIQQGLMILAGKPKVGKSWLILNVCLAVASGGVALGRIDCPRQAVWYLALEDTRRRLRDRGRKLLAGAAWPAGTFYYDTEFPKLDAGGLAKLDESLSAHPEIKVVVIDVWKRVKPKVPPGENAYDVDYSHAVLLKTLADKHGIAIVVVHHLNKLVTDDDVDSISGSLGFAAAADGWLILRRVARVKDAGLLRGKGRDLEDVDYALAWDRSIGAWSIVGDADEVTATRELVETKRILAEFGKPMTHGQFATAAGITADAARKRLYRYAASSDISSLSDGKYYVSLSPLSQLSGLSQSPAPAAPANGTPGTPGTPGTQRTPGTPERSFPKCRGCGGWLKGSEDAVGVCGACREKESGVTDEPF